MATRKISPGLKGKTQRERAAAGLVSTVVVTAMGMHISAEDSLPSIIAAFRKNEISENSINSEKRYLGHRVACRKGTFAFFANTPGHANVMKTKMQGADINIILVDNQINEAVDELISHTKQDNLLFLSCIRDVPSDIKKEIKKSFGKTKVYTLNEIGRVLENKTVLNRKRHTRPHFIADAIEKVGEKSFKVSGAVDKGFVSTRVIINGCVFAQIKEVLVQDRPLDISSLALLTKEEIYHQKKETEEGADLASGVMSGLRISENNINDQPEYSDDSLGCINLEESEEEGSEEAQGSSDNYQDVEDMEYEDLSSEIESEDLVGYEALERTKKREELNNKYKGFKGFKTINLGMHKQAQDNASIKVFRSQNLPEYYSNLSFVGSERARKKILAKKSPVPVHTPIEVVFEVEEGYQELFNNAVESGCLSIHGLFDYEGLPTICTLSFNTKETISMYNKDLSFDYGFFYTTPQTVVLGNGSEIVKCKTEGTSGTACFIGPLVLTDDKIFVYRDTGYVGTATQALRKDPIIIRTVVFRGIPAKIHKRSCIVAKMFHTREEVKYFKDIKLYSSKKKEGHIKKPLGEKGLMKCYFFPPVKHGEKIYMELARRVFINPEEN
ncbi:pre-rRNA-processing protein TSR1 [Nematocida minor]|uniref:pre-rRNA-processing protein TSR1 n=1 Tax=Nematocida minor TaxID=1912983 RepID=UPI0022205059|nr:pre-rRNA-processing protein TSR1 [Nematocida minor]KAI5189488.1 pre-rRNA-processing protein TSR1 [Nematocida minor]